jgi:hypothetical protein
MSTLKRNKWIFLILLLVTIFSLGMVAANTYLVPKIEEGLSQYLKENCPTCKFKADDITVSILDRGVKFKGIAFSGWDPHYTAMYSKIDRLDILVDAASLFTDHWVIRKINIIRPTIEVVEGDLKYPSEKERPISDESKKIVIHEINLRQGDFTYVRVHNGKRAPIHLEKIDIDVEKIGNTPELIDQPTKGVARAVLENSGKVKIETAAIVFNKSPHIDTKINISRLDLDRTNRYFQTQEGVVLTGQLLEGQSEYSIRGKKFHGYVRAEYKDLDIQFEKNEERTALLAFFNNLVKTLKLRSENLEQKWRDQTSYVTLEREPEETLLTLMFRGMREAALEVATTPPKTAQR